MSLAFEIFSFELVTVNSPYHDEILVIGSQRVSISLILVTDFPE